MKSWAQAALGIALAATMVACSGDKRANDANSTARDGGAVGTAGVNSEKEFIEDQLEDGQAEIALAQLAVERAANPQAKEFAQMMLRDHQKAGDELRKIAVAGNLNPPTELDSDHKNAQEELAKLSGPEFDRKYMKAMVDEHEEAVREIEKKLDSSNPEVRNWANTVLPTVRQHRDRAKQIEQSLEQK